LQPFQFHFSDFRTESAAALFLDEKQRHPGAGAMADWSEAIWRWSFLLKGSPSQALDLEPFDNRRPHE